MKKLLVLVLGLALIGLAPVAKAVVSYTTVGNANYTQLASDQRLVYTVAFTAPRTLTLVSAGASCIGQGPPVSTCTAASLEIIDQTGVVSATNTLTITPAANETINNSTSSIVIGSAFSRIILIPVNGSDWQIVIYAPGQYPGSTTNDNAVAGSVGEFIQAYSGTSAQVSATGAAINITSAPSLATTAIANVAQALLTAGDWDCRANAFLTPSSNAAVTQFAAWTSTVSAASAGVAPAFTVANANANQSLTWLMVASVTSPNWAITVPTVRYSLAASTSVYLNVDAVFSAGGLGGNGYLNCRRMR